MAITQQTTGQTLQCDGCGRVDSGAGPALGIGEFILIDPNVVSEVRHHYCSGCAERRGYTAAPRLEFGWTSAPVPDFAPNETKEQAKARMEAHGPFIPGTGENS